MIKSIISAMQVKGHSVFENDSKPFNLNYVGIRNASSVGKFNDLLVLFWKFKGRWNQYIRMGTTDPGIYYLENPLNVSGTAILKEGQMKGAFKLGLHRGRANHPALVQRKEVTVIRDGNRDDNLDIIGGKEFTGMFGINHHGANKNRTTPDIGKWSAGCQVSATWGEHEVFIKICQEASEIFGNSFTYTLLNINDIK